MLFDTAFGLHIHIWLIHFLNCFFFLILHLGAFTSYEFRCSSLFLFLIHTVMYFGASMVFLRFAFYRAFVCLCVALFLFFLFIVHLGACFSYHIYACHSFFFLYFSPLGCIVAIQLVHSSVSRILSIWTLVTHFSIYLIWHHVSSAHKRICSFCHECVLQFIFCPLCTLLWNGW